MNFLGFEWPYMSLESSIAGNIILATHINVTGIHKFSLMVHIIFQRIQSYAIVIICVAYHSVYSIARS